MAPLTFGVDNSLSQVMFLCTVGCLAASLVSICLMSGGPFPTGTVKTVSRYCQVSPGRVTGQNHPWLKTTELEYMNCELPDVQAGFRKDRGTRDQIANICSIVEKAREFQKNIYFCFIDYAKPMTVWITINCGKF